MKQITKLFLPLYLAFDVACAADQLILIVSDDFNTTNAVLTRYEKDESGFRQRGEKILVNLGRNGLAWGIGEKGFSPKKGEPVKQDPSNRRATAVLLPVSLQSPKPLDTHPLSRRSSPISRPTKSSYASMTPSQTTTTTFSTEVKVTTRKVLNGCEETMISTR